MEEKRGREKQTAMRRPGKAVKRILFKSARRSGTTKKSIQLREIFHVLQCCGTRISFFSLLPSPSVSLPRVSPMPREIEIEPRVYRRLIFFRFGNPRPRIKVQSASALHSISADLDAHSRIHI